jgi:hypothetical protein
MRDEEECESSKVRDDGVTSGASREIPTESSELV